MEGVFLSVCVPYFRYDLSSLLQELLDQAASVGSGIEVLLADDGSKDDQLIERLIALCSASLVPVMVLVFSENLGRAEIRNRLAATASGDFTLFLDADMFPDSPKFLSDYDSWARLGTADVLVGGRSYQLVRQVSAAQRLYHYHSSRTECLSAKDRQASGWRHIFTNNLMARTALLRTIPFDSAYTGWGYEDTDWALRVSERTKEIKHIDNTATHFGLVDDETLLLKYQESVINFRRVLEKFPVQVSQASVFKVARFLGRVPFAKVPFTAMVRIIVRCRVIPLFLRYGFLQIYKSLLYADIARGYKR